MANLRSIAEISGDLTSSVERGVPAANALADARRELETRKMTPAEIQFAVREIIHSAASWLIDNGIPTEANNLLACLPVELHIDTTKHLVRRALSDNPFHSFPVLFREARFEEAVSLLKAAPKQICTDAALQLLERDKPSEAFSVIERFLDGSVQVFPDGGLEMSGLYIFARCARADRQIQAKFIQYVEELRRSEKLPESYVERLLYVFVHGKGDHRLFGTRAKYRPSKKQARELKSQARESKSQETFSYEHLPDLDPKGIVRVRIVESLKAGNLMNAVEALRASVSQLNPAEGIVQQYTQLIFSLLKRSPVAIRHYRRLLEAKLWDESLLIFALQQTIAARRIDEAVELFCEFHEGSLRAANVLGNNVRHLADGAHLEPIAERLMEVDPRYAVEFLKPVIKIGLVQSKVLPVGVVRIFALCTVRDPALKVNFMETMWHYRKHNAKIEGLVLDALRASFPADEATQLLADLQADPRDHGEDLEGFFARSKFFDEPHHVLANKPIDKTASLVGYSSKA